MLRRLTGQLPIWARPTHPVLRYELGKVRQPPLRVRLLRALGVVLLLGLLLLGGYIAATNYLSAAPGDNPTESISNVLYYPLLLVQLLVRIAALASTATVVSDEIRRQNWDNLRATPVGAELTLRARWAAVFYRLRGALGLLIVMRLILIAGILYDLTAFQGRYLDLILNGVTPEVPLAFAVVLLSLTLTASLLMPITGIGFDAALGLLLATSIRQRTYSTLAQLLIMLLNVGVMVALVVGVLQFLDGQFPLEDWQAWGLLLGSAALGDWGLRFLNLSAYGEIWASVPYGILLGVALLVFAFIQALISDQLLVLAIRRAERKG